MLKFREYQRKHRNSQPWVPGMKGRVPLEQREGAVSDQSDRTWSRAIDRKMAEEGGQLLQRRMLDGRAQWWVVRHDGQVVAGTSVRDIAEALGINREAVMEVNYNTWVDARRAAKIAGYSTWAIYTAGRKGQIMMKKLSGRDTRFEPESVRRWAEANPHKPRAKGTQRKPQRRHVVSAANGNGVARLDAYLERMEGTPFEMTAEQFIEKAVDAMLDKLGA